MTRVGPVWALWAAVTCCDLPGASVSVRESEPRPRQGGEHARAWEPSRQAATAQARSGGEDHRPALATPPRAEAPKDTAELVQLRRRSRSLGMPGAAIQNGDALEPFFAALDATRAKKGRTRVSAWGGSLIAADHIVDVLRRTLQNHYGSAGRGFVLTDLMAEPSRRVRAGRGRPKLHTYNLGLGPESPVPLGVAGVVHLTGEPHHRVVWRLRGETEAHLWLRGYDPQARAVVYVGGQWVTTLRPGGRGQLEHVRLDLPAGEWLVMRTVGGPLAIDGLSLERDVPGVIVDTFGVPAADSRTFMRAAAAAVQSEVATLQPDLLLLILGGNEIGRLSRRRTHMERLRKKTRAFLSRLSEAAPSAACLVVGPIDKIHRRGTAKGQTKTAVAIVNRLLRRVAHASECAYLDLFAAMGGPGAIMALEARGWMHPDLIHPRREGLDLAGLMVTDALTEAYLASSPPTSAQLAKPSNCEVEPC